MTDPNLRAIQSTDSNPEYTAYRQSTRWQKLRRAASLRAQDKCEICLRREGCELAHLTYDRIFNERLSDVIWVCADCHRKLDGRKSS